MKDEPKITISINQYGRELTMVTHEVYFDEIMEDIKDFFLGAGYSQKTINDYFEIEDA